MWDSNYRMQYDQTDIEKWSKKFPEIKTDEKKLIQCLKTYIASLYDTKKLLSVWRHAQYYYRKYSNYECTGSYQYCDESQLCLELQKFSKNNLRPGKKYYVYYTEAEFRELLASRENVE